MMLYPSINELNEKMESRYTLVSLAAKRARDIIAGKPVLTEVKAERPVSLATNEIAEDLISYRRVDLNKLEAEDAGENFTAEEIAAEAKLEDVPIDPEVARAELAAIAEADAEGEA